MLNTAVLMLLAMVIVIAWYAAPVSVAARRERHVIVIEDYTSPKWAGMVSHVTDAVRQIEGVSVRYRRMAGPCPARTRGGRVHVCSIYDENDLGSGTAVLPHKRHQWPNVGVRITLNDWDYRPQTIQYHQNTVCHELMHALANMREGTGPGSCVWDQTLPLPGPEDVRAIKRFQREMRQHR